MHSGRDETEFRDFTTAFSPTLVRTAYLLLRDRDAAQDVVQTTLMRTFGRWRVARRAPEAYSRQVLVNVCRNHWRHRGRHPVLAGDERLAEIVDPAAGSEHVENRLMLQGALGELTELHREVIVARFFLELSVTETAELLRVPPGTVKSATHRALARLHDLIIEQPQEAHHDG